MIESKPTQPPRATEKTGLYQGETGSYLSRGQKQCESEWNAESEKGFGPYTFDTLVLRRLQEALANGQDEVVILDFGCGEAALFNSFFEMPLADSPTLQFLQNNPKMKLKCIGVTDITGLQGLPDDVGLFSKIPLPLPAELSGQVEAFRVIYAVSAAQTMDQLLQHLEIEKIHLALATHSLNYLSTKTFKATLETLLTHLDERGAQFVAAPYDTRLPGFTSAMLGVELDVQDSSKGISNILRQDKYKIYDEDVDFEKIVANLEKAFVTYQRLGVVSDQELQDAIAAFLPLGTKLLNGVRKKSPEIHQLLRLQGNSQIFAFRSLIWFFISAENKLYDKQHAKVVAGKHRVLAELQQQFPGVRFGERVIEAVK